MTDTLGSPLSVNVTGLPGPSAYEIAVANGYTGTLEQFIATAGGNLQPQVDAADAAADRSEAALAQINQWAGKKVVVLTDSIGLGSGSNSFFYQVGQYLNANLVNEGVIAAMARNGDYARRTSGDAYGWAGLNWVFAAYTLSGSIAEKNDLITNWSSKWRALLTGDDRPATLDSATQAAILASSWENRLQPHIAAGDVDLYIFDIGYNDEQGVGDILVQLADDQDRGTYSGAMTFLIGKILAANPKNRVVLIGHYEAQLRPNIAKAQELLAARLELPLLRLWEQLGWSQFEPDGGLPMLSRILTVDGYHPHNQPDGWAVAEIARHIADWLRDGLPVAGAGSTPVRDTTPGDILAFSAASPFTPMMQVAFYDEENDLGGGKAIYLPIGQSIYNVSAGRVALTSLAGTAAPQLLTHTAVVLPQDGQAYVVFARYGDNATAIVRFDSFAAHVKAHPGQITSLATVWGAVASARLPMIKLRDAYAPNLLQGGQIMAGPMVRAYPDSGAQHVKITDPILTAAGHMYGFQSAVNGRAAAGGYLPDDVGGRLATIRWKSVSSAANTPGTQGIYLWDGSDQEQLITTGIVLEQQLSPTISVYRWTGYLTDTELSHFYPYTDMAGTGAQVVITGVQFALGMDVRRDDFRTDHAPNLFANGRDLEGSDVLIYNGDGTHTVVGVQELKDIGFTQGVIGAAGASVDVGGYFPTDRPVSGQVFTWAWYLAVTGAGTFGLPENIYLWDGDTFLSAVSLDTQIVVDHEISNQARKMRCTARIPDGITPTHWYIRSDQTGTQARSLITGVQFANGLSIDPSDFPIDPDADPAILAARDASNVQRSALFKGRLGSGMTLQRPTSKWNLLLLNGQSLGRGQETWPRMSTSAPAYTYMLGGAPLPASYASNDYPTFGAATFQPLVSQVVSEDGSTILTDSAVSALPAGNGAFGEPPNVEWARDAMARLNQMTLSEGSVARNYVTLNSAVSGQGLATFLKPNGSWYGREKDGVTKAKAAAGSDTIVVAASAWMQGEYDYLQQQGGVNRKSTYKTGLNKLFDDAQADNFAITGQTLPYAKFLYQAGSTFTSDLDADGNPGLAIGMAQLETSLERTDAFMVGPTYFTTDKNGHLDSNGSRWYGAFLAKVYHRVVHLGQDWEPLRPIRVEQVGRAVYVDFHVPEPPLVFAQPYVVNTASDIADKGFRVTDESGIVPISKIELIGQTQVAIKLDRATSGQVNVWYGHQDVGGAGMLCDSDPAVSGDYYRYLAGSGMYASANIPALVDKPYLLRNWCVAFYYPVGFGVLA